MRARRFIVSSFCVAVVAFGLLWLLAVLDDAYSPGLPPAWLRCFVLVIHWPSVATALVLHHDPTGFWAWVLLVLSGLFWGAVGEAILVFKNARKP